MKFFAFHVHFPRDQSEVEPVEVVKIDGICDDDDDDGGPG